jgi:hypothetical protein
MTTEPMDSTALMLLRRIEEIDRQDDDQIIAHLTGEVIDQYVYEFKDSAGRNIRGLSWAGTRELAQMRGNIVIGKPDVEEREDHWRVMVQATDLDRNVSVWGGTHQPKAMRLKAGGSMDDPYAFEKAVSKAQRNAIKNLIPAAVVDHAIKQLAGPTKPNRPQPKPRQTAPPLPKPQPDPPDAAAFGDEPMRDDQAAEITARATKLGIDRNGIRRIMQANDIPVGLGKQRAWQADKLLAALEAEDAKARGNA